MTDNNENKLLFFLSCTTYDSNETPTPEYESKIVSIYHVSGVDPWLIILDSSVEHATQLRSLYKLDIKSISIAKRLPLSTDGATGRSNEILSWISIKGSQASSFIKEICSADFRVEEFKAGYTVKALCDKLREDGFSLAKIEDLNELLKRVDLYRTIKQKMPKAPSEKLKSLEESYTKETNDDNLKRLNRSALEERYAQ